MTATRQRLTRGIVRGALIGSLIGAALTVLLVFVGESAEVAAALPLGLSTGVGAGAAFAGRRPGRDLTKAMEDLLPDASARRRLERRLGAARDDAGELDATTAAFARLLTDSLVWQVAAVAGYGLFFVGLWSFMAVSRSTWEPIDVVLTCLGAGVVVWSGIEATRLAKRRQRTRRRLRS